MSAKYILFDLPSKDPCKCWSPNPWKTRFLLNYKNLPYETQWVEYPDIKPMFKGKVTSEIQGTEVEDYTIPTVRFLDGTYMQDSRKIVDRIEQEHPDPPLHLHSQYLKKVEGLMPQMMMAIAPDFIPKVAKRVLTEASQPYFYRTREASFGMSLDQVEIEKGGDNAWMNAAPTIQQVSKLLREQTNGPYFEGERVTYVDFVWGGFLRFMKGLGDDIYQKALESSGDREAHEDLLKSLDPWLARDDH